MSLKDKVALVTGAAQGIGLATVRQLLQSGAKVGLVDISNQLDKTCDVLRDEFGSKSVLSMPCDVTDDKSLRGVFEKTIDEFGSLDIVVNNAGILDEKNWRKMIQVNLSAVIAGTYHALELMSLDAGGVIINVSSAAALHPSSYGPVYSATKSGVVAFSRALKSIAESKNVRINCICPYFVDTPMGVQALSLFPEANRKEILQFQSLSPDEVAEGIMELIMDTSKSGAVMKASAKSGRTYVFENDTSKAKL